MRIIKRYYWWFIPVAVFLLLGVGLGYNGLYGQDAHEYYRYTKSIKNWMLGGDHPGAFFWPVVYPLFSSLSEMLFGFVREGIGNQVFTLISFIGFIYAMRSLFVRIYGEVNSVMVYLITYGILAAYIVRSAYSVMADMTAICFIAFAFRSYVLYSKEEKHYRHFLHLTFFASLAFFTRYQSALVLFIPCLDALIKTIRKKNLGYMVFAMLIAVFMSMPHWILQFGKSDAVIGHYGLQNWHVLHFFKNTFYGQDGTLTFTFPNLLFSLSSFTWPGLLPLGLVLLFFKKWRKLSKIDWIIMLSFLLNALFLAGVPFQNTRHFLLIYPLILFFFYEPFTLFLNFVDEKLRISRLVLLTTLFLVQVALCVRALVPNVRNQRNQREIATYIKKNFPSKQIYTFSMEMALQSYGCKNEVENVYSNVYEEFEEGALFLVNESFYSSVFKDKNPMINWETASRNYKLMKLEGFSSGWNLYLITSKK